MLILQFPASVILNQAALNINPALLNSYGVDASNAALVDLVFAGNTIQYTTPCAASALAVVAAINAAQGQSGAVLITPLSIVLGSCFPTTFPAATSTIDILGSGFYPAMQGGVINIEDLTGGYDSNGFKYSIKYIDPGHIQATYQSSGDATTGPSFIYFTDINGVIVGEINGITTS